MTRLLLTCACLLPSVGTSFGQIPVAAADQAATEPPAVAGNVHSLPVDPDSRRPNLVLILTDDQRSDEMVYMPFVRDWVNAGIQFTNAYVNTPICCPSRASILSGGFHAHWTGVRSNREPTGGAALFTDSDTLGTRLQESGYRTALIGKYLNGYLGLAETVPENVPPGWDYFLGTDNSDDWYHWDAIEGGSRSDGPAVGRRSTETRYLTDVLAKQSRDFIHTHATSGDPFFLFLSLTAPHIPADPSIEAGDHLAFTELETGGNGVYRGRAWGELPDGDVADKPLYVRLSGEDWWCGDYRFYEQVPFTLVHKNPDELFADRQRSMLAVDRAMRGIFEELTATGVLDNTIVIFTSDNGFVMGEHKLYGKGIPYEEALRVPLVIWAPGIEPVDLGQLVQVNIDLPPTILDYARAPRFAGCDGVSLRGLIEHADQGSVSEYFTREMLFFEFFRSRGLVEGDPNPNLPSNTKSIDWAAVRDAEWKYIEYGTQEAELYNLKTDPYELENVVDRVENEQLVERYAQSLAGFKGLTISVPLDVFPPAEENQAFVLPPTTVDEFYRFRFRATGGVEPYRWSAEGLEGTRYTIDPTTGRLRGRYGFDLGGTVLFTVTVTDSSLSPVTGRRQSDSKRFFLEVTR